MTRALMLTGWALSLAIGAFAEPDAGGRDPDQLTAHLEAKVTAHSPERQIVALAIGRQAGVSLGDHFFLFDEEGVAIGGSIFLVADEVCTGRLIGSAGSLCRGRTVAVVRASALSALRSRMPPGTTLVGHIARLPTELGAAWLDIGSRHGLKHGDEILIWRREIPTTEGPIDIPIARGRVSELKSDTSLVTFQPVVSNALPKPGDGVALWPAPADRRWNRFDSAVLQVSPGREGSEITIVGGASQQVTEGRLADVFRSGRYVGVASIVKGEGPLSKAVVLESMSAGTPIEGDRVLVRSPARPFRHPLSAAVFRIEGDYCLLAAGETDGVQVGERFIVYRVDHDGSAARRAIAELTVKTVKVDYAGATFRNLTDKMPGLQRWDWAERQHSGIHSWHTVGIVEQANVDARSAEASIEPNQSLAVGAIVRLTPTSHSRSAAAIVVARTHDRVLIYVPHAWGDLRHLSQAHVETNLPYATSAHAKTRQTGVPTTQRATQPTSRP